MILDTRHLDKDQSVLEIGDRNIFDKQSAAITQQKWGVSNPHPGYGKDPNILNCFGHTKYPMIINKPDGTSVTVNSEEEEKAARGTVQSVPQTNQQIVSDALVKAGVIEQPKQTPSW